MPARLQIRYPWHHQKQIPARYVLSEGNIWGIRSYTWKTDAEGRQYCENSDGSIVTDDFVTIIDEKEKEPEYTVYYVNSSGFRQDGWISYRRGTYYVDPFTGLHRGWLEQDGRRYYFLPFMYTGLQTIDGEVYYFGYNGVMRTGWVTTYNGTRYFRPDGTMVTGTQTIDGVTYRFDEDGLCISKEES